MGLALGGKGEHRRFVDQEAGDFQLPVSHVPYSPTSNRKTVLILLLALQKEVDIGRPGAVGSDLVGSSGIKCQIPRH